jgi:hypothetical protein
MSLILEHVEDDYQVGRGDSNDGALLSFTGG